MIARHDRIIVPGRIHTMAPSGPAVAEAVHVVDGVVAAVGTREEMRLRRSSATETIDLGDAALLPGFVEPHTHPDLCAQLHAWTDVSGFTYPDVAGVVAALQRAAAQTPEGEWIFAFGLDPMLTRDVGAWDRRRLDTISDRHPMFVMIQSMHTAFVNSRALAITGIDASTPSPGGGHFGRDAAGEPTGRLEEQTAMVPFLVHMDTADGHVRDLEHCALVSPDDLQRAARAGVSPSFHVNHVLHYGPELRDSILGARHSIPLDGALRAVTADAAGQLYDDEGGVLAPGRRADFTVLERDPYAVAPADLDRIAVLGTWLDGEPTAAF